MRRFESGQALWGTTLASITIRNLDEEVKTRLRVRAASNGRSMEEEARLILGDAVERNPETQDIAGIFRSYFGPMNGIDLNVPQRRSLRKPPRFD